MTRRRCDLCGREGECESLRVREMQFGTGEAFTYLHFPSCGCLQLADPPDDLGKYYPSQYYSVQEGEGGLKGWLKSVRGRYTVSGRGLLGRALAWLFPPGIVDLHRSLRQMDAAPHWRILDVGCGSGELLDHFAAAGFRNLTGVDPLLSHAETRPNGVRLIPGTMEDLEGEFDLIMLHHSLEHMVDQKGALDRVARLLRPGGWSLIRVPVTDSWAWEHYREHWAQIDAPRHLVIHSTESLERLARSRGLALEGLRRDSVAVQFFGSEGYRGGLPLEEAGRRTGWWRKRVLQSRARRLNREGRGDQAAFLFRKTEGPGDRDPDGSAEG